MPTTQRRLDTLIIEGASIKKVWIYGNGGFAKRLAEDLKCRGVQVLGFLTRLSFEASSLENDYTPVLESPHPIILGVFNHVHDPVEILEYLKIQGFKQEIYSPSQYINSCVDSAMDTYYLSADKSKRPSKEGILTMGKKLHDDKSREILFGFHEYQSKGNLSSLSTPEAATSQYLGMTLPGDAWFTEKLRWVDVGAFDGDTLRNIRRVRGPKIVQDEFLAIEPDLNNFDKLVKSTTSESINSLNLNAAVGDMKGLVSFEGEGSLSSKVSKPDSESNFVVPNFTLDDLLLAWSPTHIKMDIEGSEMQALVGAKRTLMKFRPRVAISLYHKPLDSVEIFQYLDSVCENYAWFVRSYGAHGYDTIIYGVPQ
jgi:FkbM family methyltransferase